MRLEEKAVHNRVPYGYVHYYCMYGYVLVHTYHAYKYESSCRRTTLARLATPSRNSYILVVPAPFEECSNHMYGVRIRSTDNIKLFVSADDVEACEMQREEQEE